MRKTAEEAELSSSVGANQQNVPTKQLLLFFSSTWLMLRTLQMENLLLLSLSPEVALAYMM